ncbi:hypothetical protein HDU96_001214 [Phlyctochytrium bullatum]|nr:hypothetical protein HDU96_001214 [Phlyctochytrium bullatum]
MMIAPAPDNQDGWKTMKGRGKKKKGKPTRMDPNDPAVMQEAIVGITKIGGLGKKATIEEGGPLKSTHPPCHVSRQPTTACNQTSLNDRGADSELLWN